MLQQETGERQGNKTSAGWVKPAADQLDLWLDSQGFYRKHTARDSSCLFRAVAEQVFLTQVYHTDVRRQVLDYMLRHKDIFRKTLLELGSEEELESRVDRLRNQREWGGALEIQAMARYFKVDISLVERNGNAEGENITSLGYEKKLMLCLTQDRHYDSVYTKQHINSSAFCQSLLYDLLYKKVFDLKEVDYAVKSMLHDKTSKFQREHLTLYGSSLDEERLELRDRCKDVKELLELSITPFPYKVAKALDADIYRNVEFDTWNDYRKGLRYGLCSWNCKELQVGVKCLIRNESGETYQGHVQEMSPNKGPVLVYVLELGQKVTVPYENLEVVIPPSPPVPSPSKSSNLPLSDLFGKVKEANAVAAAALKKSCLREVAKELLPNQTPVVSSSDYFEENRDYIAPSYEAYPYQEGGVQPSTDETVYPDSTKPGVVEGEGGSGLYYNIEMNQVEAKPVNLMAPKSIVADGSDLPHADITTLRFFYNLGLDHMRMNCMVRPCYLPYVAVDNPIMTEQPIHSPVSGERRYEGVYPAIPESPQSESDESQNALPPRFKKKTKQNNVTNNSTSVKRNSQAYEGTPLIQQYEVSSSSGTGVTCVQQLGTVPPPPPIPQPIYYQTIEVEGPHHPYCVPSPASVVPGQIPQPPVVQPGPVYLPEYPPVYDYHPLVYQPVPQFQPQYISADHPQPLYYLPHIPPHP